MKAAFAIGLFKAVLSPREVNEKKLIKKSNSEKDKEKPWSIESKGDNILCNADPRSFRQGTPSTRTFEVMSTWLKPSTDDARFWWHTLGGPLALLLHESGYDAHSQYESLMFMYCNIIDFFGPRPTVSGWPKSWKSFMTDDFSPIEYSWSWDPANASPRIRFSIEAIGPFAGTKKDPFNQEMTMKMIRHMGLTFPETDWSLFNYFRDGFCGGPRDDSSAEQSNDQSSDSSSTFLGFDLCKTQIAVKAYFVPVKAKLTGRSKISVLSETIRGLEKPNFKLTAYDYLLDFMTNHPEGSHLDLVGIAVDCVVPSKSRFKIYVRSSQTSFDSVQAIMSMGGRLQPFPGGTLQDLRKLWQLVLGLDENFSSSSDLSSNTSQTAGILYNFDIKAGSPVPEPKVYIPVKHYSPNDRVAVTGLTSYLNMKGQGDFAGGYKRALEGISSHRGLDSESGLQPYVACAVKNEQLVLTSYISPEIYHRARW